MLNSSELIAFAATAHADRALAFYGDVLGLPLTEDGPFALVLDANGTMLRIQKVQEHSPARATTLGWRVDDIRSAVATLAAKGVGFERYERLAQDDLDIWRSPGGALVAWFKDPDGNTLSLTEWAA